MERAFFGDGSWGRGLRASLRPIFRTRATATCWKLICQASRRGHPRRCGRRHDDHSRRAPQRARGSGQEGQLRPLRAQQRQLPARVRHQRRRGRDISAQYNDGVLKLNMPKKSAVVNAKQIRDSVKHFKKAAKAAFLIWMRACGHILGCTQVCKKLAKVRSGERAFPFRRSAAGKRKFRSPRGSASRRNTKSGLGRFFHIYLHIICMWWRIMGFSVVLCQSCNKSGLLQVCYRWVKSVDLKFCLW